MRRQRKRHHTARHRRRKAIRAWIDQELTSWELVKALGSALRAAIRTEIWRAERASGYTKTIAWLDSVRQRRPKITSLQTLSDSLGRVLDPERHQVLHSRKERWLARTSTLDQSESLETIEMLEVLDKIPFVTDPSHEVRSKIGSELRSLAFFAQLPTDLPASVLPYARVISLRVFGGWSIERIAEHDSQSVDDVSKLWYDARSWLARDDQFASKTGSLIETPPISHSVLVALQASPRLLHVLEWRAFERILAQILESLGYEVELQRGTKDGGIDVIAVKQATDFGPHRYLLQAKRSRNLIGVEPVRELLFLKHEYQATKACLATTSSFTAGAWKLADEHRWELELRDFERLREWLGRLRQSP